MMYSLNITSKAAVKNLNCLFLFFLLLFSTSCSVATEAPYLPLYKGASWKLETQAKAFSGKPVILSVLEKDQNKQTIQFVNPWMTVEWNLISQGEKYYLDSIKMNGALIPMPKNTLYFDMNASQGSSWNNAIGRITVVRRNFTVETPSGVYNNSIQFKETSKDGNDMFWTFAPGVGFVQFGDGPYAFKLSQNKITSMSPPSNTRPNISKSAMFKGERLLGIDINEANGIDYNKATSIVEELGVQFVQISLAWDRIEPGKGKYVPDILDLINFYYPPRNLSVVLSIGTIDTGKIRFPSDLKGKSFDDPEVISRFNSMMNFVISRLPKVNVLAISVGNEINAYLGNNNTKWRQYTRFQQEVRKNIKNRLPQTFVGSKIMFDSVITSGNVVSKLLEYSDALMVTYYPLHNDFIFKAPASIHNDLDSLVRMYPVVPIFVLEIGYSSGSRISSEEKQRQFIEELFLAWDRHQNRLPVLNINWLHDHPDSTINQFKNYYSSSNPNFVEYLSTLGLRTKNGVDKPAFQQLKYETNKRAWK